jgi:TonB family protein
VSTSAPRHERFGNFLLLAETERTWLANEYRAAHLGEAGFDRLVQLVRFSPASKPALPDTLVEHVKAAMKVGGPGVLRALGTGRNGAGWLSYEYNGGRSLRAVLDRAREEGFPLALDNALEVARQVCLTLEKAHARPLTDGAPLVHGYVAPWSVLVSFDGAVRLRGFGLWAGRALGGLPAEEAGTLAPEQSEQRADVRTDVYALGALVLASLRSAPLPGGSDPRGLIADTTTVEGDPLPQPLVAALERALSPRPEARHQTVAEFRQELETLLFAGDVAPTTFNLAFYMETLYRGVVEEDARAVEAAMHADYSAELKGPAPAAAPTPAKAAPVAPAPVPPPVVPLPLVPPPVVATVPPPPRSDAPAPAEKAAPPAPAEKAAPPAPERARPAAPPSRTPLIAAAVAAVVLVGGAAFYFLKLRRPAQPPAPVATTLSAEAQAAVARVQELEARLKALEEERLQAEAAAAETARQRLEAEAKARGRAVDPRALERAQEEAARKVRAQEEKRQEEEREQLERRKREEEARLAAVTPPTTAPPAVPAAEVAAAPTAPPEAPPTLVAAAEPAPAPAASAPPTPDVYEFGALGVVPPSMLSQPPLEYPMVARASRITGSVTVAAVVDEQGRVTAARATSGNPVLRKAAVDHIKARKYRPATKDGTPVKIQLVVQVNFKG